MNERRSEPRAASQVTATSAESMTLSKWARENVPFLSTALIVSLFILNLITIAHGSTSTALGLLTAAGPAKLLTGTVLRVAPVVPAIAFILLLRYRASWKSASPEGCFIYPLLVGLMLLVTPMLALAIPFLMLFLIVLSRNQTKDRSRTLPVASPLSWGMQVIPLILIAALLGRPSFPLETIVLASNERITAYVLGEQGDWTTLLLEGNRSLRIVPNDDLKSREICIVGLTNLRWIARSPVETVGLWKSPEYRRCP